MSALSRDFHLPGRSPVIAAEGMAATSHPLATSAAVDVLRKGGNAIDAAVTAAAVLAVVEPQMTGIGGDGFAIVATPDGKLHGVNGSGRAPADASADALRGLGFNRVPNASAHAVTVPGLVASWQLLLERFGTFELGRCLEPAIHYAETGAPVAPKVAADWLDDTPHIENDAGARLHYLRDGKPPRSGDVWKLPALAQTMKTIARDGWRAFYEGPIAEDIVATLKARGGRMRAEDLAGVDPFISTPVTTDYRGATIAELPPNGQGITALIILNILERFDLAGLDPLGAERFHLELEATRLGYACRDAFIADPERMTTRVADLISKGYAASLAARIDPAHRIADVTPGPVPNSDTVYLTVVDRDRRAISLINSIYSGFGSGIVTEKTGIVLQDRGACFNLTPGHVNEYAGGKRPMHTIIPAFMLKDGKPVMPFGVMGGAYQACGHAHVVTNMIDYGMGPQQALDFPRGFFNADFSEITAERGLPEATVAGLKQRGHVVGTAPRAIGGAQAILIDHERGVLIGASEHRKDGAAMGY